MVFLQHTWSNVFNLWSDVTLTGRGEARPRSAVRCTELSDATSGARPAAGRKPASASLIKGLKQTKETLSERERVKERENERENERERGRETHKAL